MSKTTPASAGRILAAVDDGYAQVKVFDPATGTRFVTPSAVRSGMAAMTALDGTGVSGAYETEGRRYSAGPEVAGEETRFDGYHVSDLNRVAIHHALVLAGLGGREVDLVVGLPVRDFFRDGSRNDALLKEKRASLAKPVSAVHAAAGRETATIGQVRIAPQAVAAWVDYAMGDDLKPRAGIDLSAPVAVVDVGGRTTDIAVVLGGESIDHARTGTENVGVLDVRALVEAAIRRQFDLEEALPAKVLDRAVRESVVRLFGRDHDVAGAVTEAKAQVAGRIERCMARIVGKASSVAAVLFVGGGAAVFPDLVGRFPHGTVAEDPEFSNARGMWRYAAQAAAAAARKAA